MNHGSLKIAVSVVAWVWIGGDWWVGVSVVAWVWIGGDWWVANVADDGSLKIADDGLDVV